MNTKTLLVLMAILGIGLWALPQTVSLFAGQHSFVNIDGTGNQIDCIKCHGDIDAEFGYSEPGSPHASFECEYCHRIESGMASGDNISTSESSTPGTSYHAASLVSCLECHGGNAPTNHGVGYLGCSDCHYTSGSMPGINNLYAGGFGITNVSTDTGSIEAHDNFVRTEDNMSRTLNGISNTGCVACHTHVSVDIMFDKPTAMKIDVTYSRTGEGSEYNIEAIGSSLP